MERSDALSAHALGGDGDAGLGRREGDDRDVARGLLHPGGREDDGIAADLEDHLGEQPLGFGLAGHLREMLGDGLAARIDLSALPLLPGALPAMAANYRSTMHPANEESAANTERVEGVVGDELRAMLYDPQTCGGLLIAIAQDHAGALLEALADADMTEAAVVGEVIAREPGPGNTLVLSQR